MRITTILPAAVGLIVLVAPAPARPGAHGPLSCAAQWTSVHGKPPPRAQKAAWRAYENAAATAGLKCVFNVTKPAPPISEAAVRTILARELTRDIDFVQAAPGDIAKVCPHYASMDDAKRFVFWQNFFTRIAWWESDHFKNQSLMLDYPEYSIGLYQMSIHNGCAMIDSEADLADAEKNTACALHKFGVLAATADAHGHPRSGTIGGGSGASATGAARYWSTLQAGSAARPDIFTTAGKSPGCSE